MLRRKNLGFGAIVCFAAPVSPDNGFLFATIRGEFHEIHASVYITTLFLWLSNEREATHVRKRQFRNGVRWAKIMKLYFESTDYSNCIITWHVWILTQICDFVVIARLLNATLVLPKIHDIEAPKHSRWVFFLQDFGTQWDFFVGNSSSMNFHRLFCTQCQ